eukprot:scaffold197354_cov30-Tisochrysis_lutea.AAC.3
MPFLECLPKSHPKRGQSVRGLREGEREHSEESRKTRCPMSRVRARPAHAAASGPMGFSLRW